MKARRAQLGEDLDDLFQQTLLLGSMVQEALARALDAFLNGDRTLADEVAAKDHAINQLQHRIEDTCTIIIATQQPVARDLRTLLTCIKIAGNLERIGDHAVHLSRAADASGHGFFSPIAASIARMAKSAIALVAESVDTFLTLDDSLALTTAQKDEELDALYEEAIAQIIASIQRYPDSAAMAARLLFLTRSLERVGDHCTNICEWVVYAVRGEHIDIHH